MKSTKKIPKTFIGFLIASFLIWLLITFSKEYATVITYSVSYKNLPQNKLLQEAPNDNIDIAIKATGFKILRSKLSNKKINIDVSNLARKKGDRFYILTKNQTSKIQNQLLSGVLINEIQKDTIFLNLGLLTSKKVALKPNVNINYHIGYDLVNTVKVTPDSIVVSGPESQIKKLNFLNLSKLDLNDVKNNFTKKVSILNPVKENNLKFSTLEATISGKVEKITEGSLQVPFSVINLPKDVSLTTLSDKVEVTFIVPLSDFAKVSTTSFKIQCDYAVSEKNNLSYLIPKVLAKPAVVKSIKIIPTKIDFLIQK